MTTTHKRLANCTDICSWRKKFPWGLKGSNRAEKDRAGGCIHHDTKKRTLRVTHFDSPLARLARRGNGCRGLVCFPIKKKKNLLTPHVCPRGACPGVTCEAEIEEDWGLCLCSARCDVSRDPPHALKQAGCCWCSARREVQQKQ